MTLTRRVLLGTTLATLWTRPTGLRAATAPQLPEAPPRPVTAQKATLRLLPSAETAILGFDGTAPGPLLRCKLGWDLPIRLVNQTDQPLTLANWGLRIPNALDGVAPLTQKPVAPGQSFDYHLTPPDAGLFGYRPFVAPNAGNQLRHGLYGAIIIDEATPPAADNDILAILADWQIDSKAQILDTPKPANRWRRSISSRSPWNRRTIPAAASVYACSTPPRHGCSSSPSNA